MEIPQQNQYQFPFEDKTRTIVSTASAPSKLKQILQAVYVQNGLQKNVLTNEREGTSLKLALEIPNFSGKNLTLR